MPIKSGVNQMSATKFCGIQSGAYHSPSPGIESAISTIRSWLLNEVIQFRTFNPGHEI